MKLRLQAFLFIIWSIVKNQISSDSEQSVIVTTSLGKVKGSLMETRLGKTIYAFRGVYYAEPPTGSLRFKPPVPIKPWEDVFDATEEGPACIQEKGINMSENCLTLNIYTKQLPDNGSEQNDKLPVIVFIFPGKFSMGTPQSFLYGPKYLLDQDVILVTINYRLATLGFINTGDQYAPGNLGLKDQVEALRWIQRNIEAFGGDAGSVTLTGQSAGSRSIVLHLLSPMSKGLFHRAIAMSGTMTTPIPPQREQIELAVKQAKLFNCSSETRDDMFQCLMERPAEDYGKTISLFGEWNDNPITIWYPSVEQDIPGVERFLTGDPEDLMRSGLINEVPVIIGVTQDEYSFKVTNAFDSALNGDNTFFQDLNDRWEELAPLCFQYERDSNRSKWISKQLAAFYFDNQPVSVNNSDALRRLYANSLAHFPVYRTATLLANFSSAPVYFYKFTYEGRYSFYVSKDTKKPTSGVGHCDDLQYIFNIDNDIYHAGSTFPLLTDDDLEVIMVKRLASIWAHFAKTDEPLPRDSELFGNLTWDTFAPEHGRYLNIGKNLSMEIDFLPEEMKLWNYLFP